MALTLASNAITFTDNTSLSSGIIGTAQLSAEAITNAQIATNAAISGTKINPNFGSQNILTTGTIAVNTSADSNIQIVARSSNEGGYCIQAESPNQSGAISLRPDGTNGNILRWGGAGINGSILRFLRTADVEVMRIENGKLLSPNGSAFFGSVTNSGNGAIMERLSNSSGEYVRYANGVQFCWHLFNSSAANNLTWSYPAGFAAGVTPVIVLTPIRANVRSIATVHYDSGNLPSNTSTLISRWVSNTAAADTCWVMCFASGRWY